MKKLLVIVLAVMVALFGATGCDSIKNFFDKDGTEISNSQGDGDQTNKEDGAGEKENENKGPGVVDSITNGGSFDGGNYK